MRRVGPKATQVGSPMPHTARNLLGPEGLLRNRGQSATRPGPRGPLKGCASLRAEAGGGGLEEARTEPSREDICWGGGIQGLFCWPLPYSCSAVHHTQKALLDPTLDRLL